MNRPYNLICIAVHFRRDLHEMSVFVRFYYTHIGETCQENRFFLQSAGFTGIIMENTYRLNAAQEGLPSYAVARGILDALREAVDGTNKQYPTNSVVPARRVWEATHYGCGARLQGQGTGDPSPTALQGVLC